MKKEPSDIPPKDFDNDSDVSVSEKSTESNLPAKPRSGSKKATQIAAIVGAVALLAIVMYPGSIIPQKAASQAAANNTSDVASIKSYPPLTSEQQTMCSSVHDDLVTVVAAAGSNSSQDAAVDMLDGVYCNRADLVNAIGPTSYPATGLAAYACEVSQGSIQDQDAADALQPYGALYCGGSTTSLKSEITDLQSAVGAISGDPKYSDSAKQISQDIAQAQSMAGEKPYAAYQQLELASKAFTSLPAG